MRVIQALVVHDVFAQRKASLDQLREGLQTLKFDEKMRLHPDLFQVLFIPPTSTKLVPEDVLAILEFPLTVGDEEETKSYVMTYIRNGNRDMLEKFLVFATGSPVIPNFGFGKIDVQFEVDAPSIFASTCLNSITFPSKFPSEEICFASLSAVLDSTGKAFNCI